MGGTLGDVGDVFMLFAIGVASEDERPGALRAISVYTSGGNGHPGTGRDSWVGSVFVFLARLSRRF
jgi:hypothetical protein